MSKLHLLWIRKQKGGHFIREAPSSRLISLSKSKSCTIPQPYLVTIWSKKVDSVHSSARSVLSLNTEQISCCEWEHSDYFNKKKTRSELLPIDCFCCCLAKDLALGCLSNGQGEKGLLYFWNSLCNNVWMMLSYP